MASEERGPYELLKTKAIYAILDGDTTLGNYDFGDGTSIPVSMPYLSGPDLCDISSLFGLPKTYSWGGSNLSRWQYLDNLMTFCIKNRRCSDLLAFLFKKEQFSKMLSGRGAHEIDTAYNHIIHQTIEAINGQLYFGGHKLSVIGQQFVVKNIDTKVEVKVPRIKSIDREYIKSISSRAMDDVDALNFDSAITKSRTLLEETFFYVIEKRGEPPVTSGNIAELYKQVKGLYNMHGDADTDRRINMLLSGLEKIVSSISEMRNKDSDAHGVGAARINIDEHHARLFVNAAMTMADFILSVAVKSSKQEYK